MAVKTLIKTSEYHDSVSLMLVARELSKLPGVSDAAVVMGTEANKSILEQAGMLTDEVKAATPNDLVIAVSAPEDAAANALLEAEKLLQKKAGPAGEAEAFRPKTVRAAVKSSPAANVAIISVAGRYAADEAWEALRRGLHVLLFSDNVSLEDEIALKQYAADHGLLLMGPGAGTAIINGVALAFANVVPAGPVGIVSAAGTGLQEVSTLLGKNGVGITQGIGTGGRDLKESVGGIMMLAGLKALQEDPATQVIVLVGKPPAPSVTQKVLEQVALCPKPTVVCFMGGDMEAVKAVPNAIPARTLEEGGLLAAKVAGAPIGDVKAQIEAETLRLKEQAAGLKKALKPGQRYLRGLFSGGTLCYEAQVIWTDLIPETVLSNAPLDKHKQMADSTRSQGHCTIDLGEEEFTVGRPHPMIDNDLRIRRLLQEAHDPEVAVIIMDVVLGYGAHMDPASELGPAIRQARQIAHDAGRELFIVASVTGTEQDPQGLSRQSAALTEAGAIICGSNAAASRLAGMLVA
ncbi:MAG TPA: acyl-CoA synthetase FdrA [Anaerolineaceae bacterium]|nr:acyl-CoA synthetase FdrA [Anaerolineaceae bacterium]HPN53731.1 acyl-CoA synthetase FdrA [Anaerolineaceae bacterium]